MTQAIADWNAAAELNLVKVAGGTKPRNCRPTAGRIEVCNATYGNNGWLGIAQIWASGAHITQAITKLNDTYFNTPTYNTPAWRRLVTCQEIAHDFGLDHQDEAFTNTEPRLLHGLHERSGRRRRVRAEQRAPERARLRADSRSSTRISTARRTVAASLPGSSAPAAMTDIEFEGSRIQWGPSR